MSFEASDLKPRIGSVIKADPRALVSGAFAKELRALLIERGVLVFRDLDITHDEHRALMTALGKLRVSGDGDGLQKVTLDAKESPEYAAFFPTTFFWHMDGHYNQTVPCFAASLRPARLPPEGGGQTEFLNTYAAYDDLPDAEKPFLDRLRVVHSQIAANVSAYPDAPEEQAAAWRRPSAVQPLVWLHASERKSLLLGGSASHIEGMHPAESYDLLLRLRHHATQPQYVYSHEWRMNDLVIWDNTGTMHRVRPFDPNSGRLLNRFTLDGEEPIRAP